MGLLLLIVVSLVAASQELNELTLGHVNNGETWLVVFHTTWCQFCQSVLPVLDHVVPEPSYPFRVAHFDCTARIQLCASLGFSTWPSIAIVKNEHLWTLRGSQRDAKALSQFARAPLGDVAPDRTLKIPAAWTLVQDRVLKEIELARQDLLTLYENYDDSVALLAMLGVGMGFALGSLTWRRRQAGKKTKKE